MTEALRATNRRMNMKISTTLIGLTSLIMSQAFAGSVSPSPRQNVMVSRNAVPDGATGVIINGGCYGTNNRGTTNQLSPDSRIVIRMKMSATSTALIDFPSKMASPGGNGTASTCGITMITNDSLMVKGTLRSMDTILATSGSGGQMIVDAFSVANLNNTGSRTAITCQNFPISFGMNLTPGSDTSYSAIQVFTTTKSPQAFYGYNGLMDRGTKLDVKKSTRSGGYSDTNQFIQISGAYPGQDGFCGGFHSPLMFFFKDAHPAFTGRSLLLKGEKIPTSWVEENHEGYFLVNLKNANAVIKVESLFGDNSEFKNGFDALRKLDVNQDRVMDKKDKAFKNLYLWKDANGNSKNDKGEVKSLAEMKVESIDLKYNDEFRLEKNKSVFKGNSTFNFMDENGKAASGQIYDVFFESLEK